MAEDRGEGEDEARLRGAALAKEVARLIRLARKHWDAHENLSCRRERERALDLYARCGAEEKALIPQVLLVWLRYRSEKYFGPDRTPPGTPRGRRGGRRASRRA